MVNYVRIYQIIKQYIRACWDAAVPVGILFLLYRLLDVFSEYMSLEWYMYTLVMVATSATVSGVYYKTRRYAYGAVLGGFLLYYVIYNLIYVTQMQVGSTHRVAGLIALNGLVFLGAVIFKGRLLACLGIIGSFMVPWVFMSMFVTMQMLVGYCIAVLAVVMIVSYSLECFWLNILSFTGYLLYHETIFAAITIDPQYGVMTLNELFFVMGILFVLYTIVPILMTIIHKEDFSQPLLMAIVGAYTFLVSEAAVAYQLQRIHELPFFLKIWVKDIPSLSSVHIQMSWIYAVAYGLCGTLLLFMNRHARMMLASLLTLFCLSLIGLLYIHNFPFWELIAYLKDWIIKTFLVAGAGFEPATFGL